MLLCLPARKIYADFFLILPGNFALKNGRDFFLCVFFFGVSISHETRHENSSRNSGKIGAKSGAKFGTKT